MESKIRENRRNKGGNDGGDSCRNDSADTILVEDGDAETNDCYIIKMLQTIFVKNENPETDDC